MRTGLVVVMVLMPAAAVAYHFGPGQQLLALDDASTRIQRAEEHVRKQNFAQAILDYDAALARIPADRVDLVRNVRLERAKAQLSNQGLSEAYDELTALKEETEAASATDQPISPEFTADLRRTMAQVQYYMTWMQRLEGEPRELWEPDIEAARQNYKLLADAARSAGNEQQSESLEGDLEAAIRLARLDLSDLQALPLPKQCQGCCSGNCKCKGKGKNPNKANQKKEDARGAGSGPPPDEKGS